MRFMPGLEVFCKLKPKIHFLDVSINQIANIYFDCHNQRMPADSPDLIPTRASLLARLKNLEDQASWREFFDTYWQLIYSVCVKRGLTPAEAEDVVQETMCEVVKHMPKFNYDRNLGTFKGWLLTMVRWRIIAQFRRRPPMKNMPATACADSSEGWENLPANEEFQALWDQQWEHTILEAAVGRTRRMDPHKFQIFDLLVNQQLTADAVAKKFGINVNQIYIIKHRVTQQIKAEVERLKHHVI